MRKIIVLFVAITVLLSCGSPAAELPDLDLMSEGIPLKIKAPKDAKVKKKDLGVFKDITIKNDDKFYIQITAGQAYDSSAKVRKNEELESIKEQTNFSRIIKEDDTGFIYEKKVGDVLSYDFRELKIQGDTEYLFQTGLIGSFSLEEVELMFDAVN